MRITEDRKGRLLETLWELNDRFQAEDDEALEHMFSAITEFAQEAAALVWQPIETAPKDGTHILLLVPDYDTETNYRTGNHTKTPCARIIEGWWGDDPFWSDTDNWEVSALPSHGCGC